MGSVQSRGSNQQIIPDFDMSFLSNELFPWFPYKISEEIGRFPEWSIYPAMRDARLRSYYFTEPIMAGAIYSLTAKMKSMPVEFIGPESARNRATNLFAEADFGNGHMSLIEKTLQDLLTQDNGYFWELVGRGNPNGELLGAPTAVNYLDPARCYRTFDPIYPVLYVDPITGERHRMHKSRVHFGSSMPSPIELARGVGKCAVTRVLERVRLMKGMLQHRLETVTGTQKRAIIHGKGVSARTLRRALRRTEAEADEEELIEHQGIPLLTTPQGVELNILSLAGLPDGYVMMDEHTVYVYIVALGLGVDAREIWPATVSGATKADASVQHMKARGKGFADLITELERAHNVVLKRINPKMKAVYDYVDDERDQMVAEINERRTSILKSYKDAGAITALEMRALGIKDGILNAEVLDNPDALDGMANFEEPDPSLQPTVPGAPQPAEEEPADDEEDDEVTKVYSGRPYQVKSVDDFESMLRAAARGLWSGSFSILEFQDAWDSALRRGLTDAVYTVASQLGFLPSDLTIEERIRLSDEIAKNMSYAGKLAGWIFENRKGIGLLSDVYVRIKDWIRLYNKVQNLFKTILGNDVKLMWTWQAKKEHCTDCARYNGRVHRASSWRKYDIRPQHPALACTGIRCGCTFIPTSEPASPGFPPRIRGKIGGHVHDELYEPAT